jgi:hypothetical protein
MPKRSSKPPDDPNEAAKAVRDRIADLTEDASEDADVTPEDQEEAKPEKKNPAAVALGRLGGKKGGPARAEKLSAEQRREIAKKAAQARWKDRKPNNDSK